MDGSIKSDETPYTGGEPPVTDRRTVSTGWAQTNRVTVFETGTRRPGTAEVFTGADEHCRYVAVRTRGVHGRRGVVGGRR